MAQSLPLREPAERGANPREQHGMPNRDRRTNRLLSLLSDDDYQRLRPHLSQVALDYKKRSHGEWIATDALAE